MGPSVIAASSTQVNVLVNSVFASNLGNGPVTWLQYSFRLMQLPLGIFGVALGTVSLPLLARMAAGGNIAGFRTELARGMRLAFLLTIPASIGLILLAGPIMSVLFQHGRFNAHEVLEAAAALRFYAIGLCGYAALKVLVNAFYAIDRRKTPMFVSFGAVGLNLLLNWLFTVRLGLGSSGLAFSTACIATSNFLICCTCSCTAIWEARVARHALAPRAPLGGLRGSRRYLLAGNHYLLAGWALERFWPKAGSLAAVIVVGAGAFFFARPCSASARCRTLRTRYSAGCGERREQMSEGSLKLWFESALLPGGWARRVRITGRDGIIGSIEAEVDPADDDERHAVCIPGSAQPAQSRLPAGHRGSHRAPRARGGQLLDLA